MQNRLKEIRVEKKITQSELSKKSNISRVTICEIENGKRPVIQSDTMFKIADALGVGFKEIFG